MRGSNPQAFALLRSHTIGIRTVVFNYLMYSSFFNLSANHCLKMPSQSIRQAVAKNAPQASQT
ncbi:hypothetical protein SAMN04487935_3334 [Flavobacterium noncentrifugens]|uniref:Uncharacterized protein n=1 Tax=Flavobacterium noncentrifugens TaxID=1128970 RepID=A0A1G9BS63_9FLAO|nr:hypothetical protein SAMN04487935_3334 [Flavobacterium noncentrifugens]